jgi:hypothetical protein
MHACQTDAAIHARLTAAGPDRAACLQSGMPRSNVWRPNFCLTRPRPAASRPGSPGWRTGGCDTSASQQLGEPHTSRSLAVSSWPTPPVAPATSTSAPGSWRRAGPGETPPPASEAPTPRQSCVAPLARCAAHHSAGHDRQPLPAALPAGLGTRRSWHRRAERPRCRIPLQRATVDWPHVPQPRRRKRVCCATGHAALGMWPKASRGLRPDASACHI